MHLNAHMPTCVQTAVQELAPTGWGRVSPSACSTCSSQDSKSIPLPCAPQPLRLLPEAETLCILPPTMHACMFAWAYPRWHCAQRAGAPLTHTSADQSQISQLPLLTRPCPGPQCLIRRWHLLAATADTRVLRHRHSHVHMLCLQVLVQKLACSGDESSGASCTRCIQHIHC